MMWPANDAALNVKRPFLRGSKGNRGGFSGLNRLFYAQRRDIKAMLNVGRSDVQLHRLTGLHPDFRRGDRVFLHDDVDVLSRSALVLASHGKAEET